MFQEALISKDEKREETVENNCQSLYQVDKCLMEDYYTDKIIILTYNLVNNLFIQTT